VGTPDYSALAARQRARLDETRAQRDQAAVRTSLAALGAKAGGDAPLMPGIIDAVRTRATLGEISDTLRDVWGVYRP
jgi:methylmalonyl-CoA mutase N-terminal domain/subunit